MEPLENHLSKQAERDAGFFWHRVRWKAVSSYLPLGSPLTVLDVGAGAGLVGAYLSRERPEARYEFIEPIASLEAQLVERYGAERNRREDADLASADVVTLLDVVEHVEDDHAFVADLGRRVGPGTTIVVTVPAGRRFWSQWDVLLGHHRRYERDDLRRLLSGCGFELIEVSYLFPELVPAAWWRTRSRRRPPEPTSSQADAEFPDLPAALNAGLLLLGSATSRLRRFAPIGTSLFAVART